MKKFDLSQKFFEDALAIEKVIYEGSHIEVVKTEENLAMVYYEMEMYDHCFEKFENSLLFKKRELGEYHPEVGLTLLNLGNLYRVTKDYEKAIIYFEKASEIFKKAYGEKHFNFGAALGYYGITKKGLFKKGDSIQKKNEYMNFIKIGLNIIEKCGNFEENPDYLIIKAEREN